MYIISLSVGRWSEFKVDSQIPWHQEDLWDPEWRERRDTTELNSPFLFIIMII